MKGRCSVLSAERSRGQRGQVLAEYSLMLTVCAVFALLFLILFAACSLYGSRLISLVSWEPSPPDRSQMESIMQGKF